MTIAEKLQTIAENEPKVYEAGREKGYQEGYTDATSGTAFETDDSIAYLKVVPSASENFAQVLKLGGMSYKTKNLIPFPYYNGTQTSNGITFTVNADGTITANGNNNTTSLAAVLLMLKPLAAGTYTYSFGGIIPPDGVYGSVSLYENGSWVKTLGAFTGSRQQKSFTFTITEEEANYDAGLNYAVTAGYSVSNYTAYPMLNEGSTALPYEPYFEGIRNAKVTELVSEGANLFDISKALNDVLVDNGDGTYTMTNKGNANGTDSRFSKKVPLLIPANTSFAFFGTKLSDIMASFVIDFADASSTTYPIDGLNRTQTYAKDVINIQIYLPTQYAGQSATFSDFQIEYGTVATEYKPYIGTIATKPIPEALRNFLADKGYGLGINETYYNYIDFERKVFVQRCKKIVFDGSENWIEKQVGSALVFRLTDVVKGQILGNGLCNKYEYTSNAQINPSKVDKGIYAGQSWVTIRDVGLANVSALKAQLATWYAEGNPLTVIYPLGTAIETDISAYLTGDSLIEVQGGGTITAVNEFELAAPSKIQFIKKVGA